MNLKLAKENMIKQQIRILGVPYGDLLNLITEMPREVFLSKNFKNLAYSEVDIPLSNGQTEFTLRMITKIFQFLQPKKDENALVVGCGSGYLTALLAKLANFVNVIDNCETLLLNAKNSLKFLGIYNVKHYLGKYDNLCKIFEDNKFDLIIFQKLEEVNPQKYLKYLSISGRLIFFRESSCCLKAVLVQKLSNGSYKESLIFDAYKPVMHEINTSFQF